LPNSEQASAEDTYGASQKATGTDIVVRPADPVHDLGAIDELYVSEGGRATGGMGKRDRYLLAWKGQQLVGALMYREEEARIYLQPPSWASTFDNPESWLAVMKILVAASHRRGGIGRLLMAEAAKVSVWQGLPCLWTWPDPRGKEKWRGRVDFFKACGMTEFHDDEHLVMVGAAEAVCAGAVA
jgi:GNAT superfamily N-acetyltransferase